VKVPVPPLPAILPVSNLPPLSVNVWAAESLLVTVTFVPAFTVSVPAYLKLLMVIAAAAESLPELAALDDGTAAEAADDAAEAADVAAATAELTLVAVLDDELQAASTTVRTRAPAKAR
jgi:hypothetical protein